MRHRELRIKLPMKRPIDSKIDVLLPTSNKQSIDDVPTNTDDPTTNVVDKNLSADVPNPKPTWEEPPWTGEEATKEVLDTLNSYLECSRVC